MPRLRSSSVWPPRECRAKGSRVVHVSSGRSAAFGELARVAATLPVPTSPSLKNPDSFTIRRTSPRRLDIPSKVDGTARYAIDFTTPGMLYAAVAIAPVFGGTLQSVDTTPAESMPGVKKVVKLDEAVAVVADSFWRARRALSCAQARVLRRRSRRRVDRLDLRRLRQGARSSAGSAVGRRENGHRRLPRPVPRSRDDGADGLHGAGR